MAKKRSSGKKSVADKVDEATKSWSIKRRLDALSVYLRGCYRYNAEVTLADFLADEDENRNTDHDLQVDSILARYVEKFGWSPEQQVEILVGFMQEQADNKDAPGFLEFMTLITEERLEAPDPDDEAPDPPPAAAKSKAAKSKSAGSKAKGSKAKGSKADDAADDAGFDAPPADVDADDIPVGATVEYKHGRKKKAVFTVVNIEDGTLDLAAPDDLDDVIYTSVDPDRVTFVEAADVEEATDPEPEGGQDADGNDAPPKGRLGKKRGGKAKKDDANVVPHTLSSDRWEQWQGWLSGDVEHDGRVKDVLDTVVVEFDDHNVVINPTVGEGDSVYLDVFLEEPANQDVAIADIDPPPTDMDEVLTLVAPEGPTYSVQLVCEE